MRQICRISLKLRRPQCPDPILPSFSMLGDCDRQGGKPGNSLCVDPQAAPQVFAHPVTL